MRGAATAAAFLWLLLALPLLHAYGPTWDCAEGDYPLGESLLNALTSKDASVRDAPLHATCAPSRAPHPEFEMHMPWYECYPLGGLLSAISCRIFWSSLAWLPAVQAHALPVVLIVALLVAVTVRFVGARLGVGAGLFAAAFLVASPRFFAEAMNNVKDAPEACLYTFTILAGARAAATGRRSSWLLTGALAGASLAQKTNALFLPVELALVFAGWRLARVPVRAGPSGVSAWRGAALALAGWLPVYFALSPTLWADPVARLGQHYGFVLDVGNPALHALASGRVAASKDWRVDFDGVLEALWTTPLPLLALAAIGAFATVLSRRDRVLLGVAVALPIGRTLLPGNANFDGVRHFLEFLPPLCMLAAAGFVAVARAAERLVSAAAATPALRVALGLALLAPGAWATARSHPNGCAWYNALVGGLRGAQERGLPEATDYWGNSYWQGLAWLDLHAERDAAVFVPVAGHIVRACAPVRLRSDLRVLEEDQPDCGGVLYVMYITRPSWYPPEVREIDRTRAPVHAIEVDGAPILKIHRFEAGSEADAIWRELRHADSGLAAQRRISHWAQKNRSRARRLTEIVKERGTLGRVETLARMRGVLPTNLHADAELFLNELEYTDAWNAASSPGATTGMH